MTGFWHAKHRQCCVYGFLLQPDIYVVEIKHEFMQKEKVYQYIRMVFRDYLLASIVVGSGELKCMMICIYKKHAKEIQYIL